ncbi:invasion protein IagB [Pseudomonas sp. ABAC21]|nr:invasion protein IagB [Pseudomonas sp. ABAC21]
MIKRLASSAVLSAVLVSSRALADCWEDVAGRYDIEPELLQAIAAVESGYRANAMNNANSDGSRDIGLMQINSVHLPRLLKQGASILAGFIQRFGYNWTAVGSYNAGAGSGPQRDALREQYAQKIWVRYEALVALRH